MAKPKSTAQVAGHPIYPMVILFPSNFSFTKLGASTSMA
jgi:hypothetical protein